MYDVFMYAVLSCEYQNMEDYYTWSNVSSDLEIYSCYIVQN